MILRGLSKLATSTPTYSPLTRLLLGCYASLKKTGVLELPLAKRAFLNSYFLYKRYLEDPFFKFSRRYPELFEGGVVLDVGANCGYTAIVFAQTGASHVYAFEPDAANVTMLNNVLSSRGVDKKVTVVAAAVGAEDGFVDLWFNAGHHADHRVATSAFKDTSEDHRAGIVRVPLVALDSFVAKPDIDCSVSFIKIDVQGFELPVCQGMAKILDRFPQVSCALEYCPAQIEELGFSGPAVLDFFTQRGFNLFLLEKTGRLRECTPHALLGAMDGRGYVDILATRRKEVRV